MGQTSIHIENVYPDFPDLIELRATVQTQGWAATAAAYASPPQFGERAQKLREWLASPEGTFEMVEEMRDSGWSLTFSPYDSKGNIRCAVSLWTDEYSSPQPRNTCWKMSVEVFFEIGMLDRFARECIALSNNHCMQARIPVA